MKYLTTPMMFAGGISLAVHSMVFLNTQEPLSLTSNNVNAMFDIVLVDNRQNDNPVHEQIAKTGKPVINHEQASPRKHQHARQQQETQKPVKHERAEQRKPTQTAGSVNKPAQAAASSKYEHAPVFIAMLHKEINQYKFYPVSAQKLNQQGVVKVAFQMLHNGDILGLHIQSSSGVHSLDRAALYAVNRIQPFLPAKEFVKSAENFQLDIIFKL